MFALTGVLWVVQVGGCKYDLVTGDLCGLLDCWDALTDLCVYLGQRCSEYCQNGGICELKPSGEASCRYVTKTLKLYS